MLLNPTVWPVSGTNFGVVFFFANVWTSYSDQVIPCINLQD